MSNNSKQTVIKNIHNYLGNNIKLMQIHDEFIDLLYKSVNIEQLEHITKIFKDTNLHITSNPLSKYTDKYRNILTDTLTDDNIIICAPKQYDIDTSMKLYYNNNWSKDKTETLIYNTLIFNVKFDEFTEFTEFTPTQQLIIDNSNSPKNISKLISKFIMNKYLQKYDMNYDIKNWFDFNAFTHCGIALEMLNKCLLFRDIPIIEWTITSGNHIKKSSNSVLIENNDKIYNIETHWYNNYALQNISYYDIECKIVGTMKNVLEQK